MTAELDKPNWLFRVLILISLGVHLLLFLHITYLHRPRDISRIELTLKEFSSPFERQIPKPRQRFEPFTDPPEPIQAEALHEVSSPIEPLEYAMPKPVDPLIFAGEKKIPRLPAVEDATVARWQAEPETLSDSMSLPGKREVMTESDYTRLVQQRIETVKQYPKRAQRRKEQGVAKIVFTIGKDGEIVSQKIIESSGSRILDGAAMDALKKASPFDPPPNGPMVIQLPIRFELL